MTASSVRLHFVVEGQTEEAFVNQVLKPHLGGMSIWVDVRRVETGRKRGFIHRGGIISYAKVKKDITNWLSQDRKPDARFTTMFDLYGLPESFPGYGAATRERDPYARVRILEDALREEIGDRRFIPYFQLHEFEALLLSDPRRLDVQFHDQGAEAGIRNLIEMVSGFASPELIDDGRDTAPSKRITSEIPEYGRMKASSGPIVAKAIGLDALRSKCRHFAEWLDKLETLTQ